MKLNRIFAGVMTIVLCGSLVSCGGTKIKPIDVDMYPKKHKLIEPKEGSAEDATPIKSTAIEGFGGKLYHTSPVFTNYNPDDCKMFGLSAAYSTYLSDMPVEIKMPQANIKFEPDKCRYFFDDKTKENTVPEYYLNKTWFCYVGDTLVFYPCRTPTDCGGLTVFIPLYRFYDDLGREMFTYYDGIPTCDNGIYVVEDAPEGIASYSVDFYTESMHALEEMNEQDYENSLRQNSYIFNWGSRSTSNGCDILMRRVHPDSTYSGTIRLLSCELTEDSMLKNAEVVEMELKPEDKYITKDFKPNRVYFYIN